VAQKKKMTVKDKIANEKLTRPQADALVSIASNSKFQSAAGINKKTQEALVQRELALRDRTGTQIKPTAKGRKVAQSL
jgi:hypothetical protein